MAAIFRAEQPNQGLISSCFGSPLVDPESACFTWYTTDRHSAFCVHAMLCNYRLWCQNLQWNTNPAFVKLHKAVSVTVSKVSMPEASQNMQISSALKTKLFTRHSYSLLQDSEINFNTLIHSWRTCTPSNIWGQNFSRHSWHMKGGSGVRKLMNHFSQHPAENE